MTSIGFAATILRSTMVGLTRGVSEGLDPTGGAAMIYSPGGLLLVFTVGFPNLHQIPRHYLLAGSALFASYEICLALSLGFIATRQQAIEVGMVNYLWPSLTTLFTILFNGQKSSWLVIPGLLLALSGVSRVPGGEYELSPGEIINNVVSNPLSYILAFAGVSTWVACCTVTAKYVKGKSGIILLVLLTALTLWLKFLASTQSPMLFSWPVVIKPITVSVALGSAYAVWNIGILHGNVSPLAAVSYFIPVLSSALAVVLLSVTLSWPFWQGVGVVCLGSLLCWYAICRQPRSPPATGSVMPVIQLASSPARNRIASACSVSTPYRRIKLLATV